MSFRLVLYAEGNSEALGVDDRPPPAPGTPIPRERFGAAHVLLQRALEGAGCPTGAILFEEPLRTKGRIPRGSDLLHQRTLRQLLTWPNPTRTPDLAVVLVDADGDSQRKQRVRSSVEDLPVAKVVAVAIQEFEAWLITDIVAVAKALSAQPATPPAPESMNRGEAKRIVSTWIAASPYAAKPRLAYRTIAEHLALDEVAKRCAAFGELQRDLAAAYQGSRP